MKHLLEYCTRNVSLGTHEAIRMVQEQYDCEVHEYGCLTHCGTCYAFPYVIVNGKQVEAEDAGQLAARILQIISESAV